MKLNMVCIKFDQQIKNLKNLGFFGAISSPDTVRSGKNTVRTGKLRYWIRYVTLDNAHAVAMQPNDVVVEYGG